MVYGLWFTRERSKVRSLVRPPSAFDRRSIPPARRSIENGDLPLHYGAPDDPDCVSIALARALSSLPEGFGHHASFGR
jgi:hypothetical protein